MGVLGTLKKAAGYTPIGVAARAGQKLYEGDYAGAADAAGTYTVPWQAAKYGYRKGEELYGDIKDAVNAPYDKAREGFDVILGQLGNMKNERLARKDKLYADANAQMEDSRRAMAAVYGDPSTWRL